MNRNIVGLCVLALALMFPLTAMAADLEYREWMVGGVKREALVQIPVEASRRAMPVVFAFHGHGGSMRQASNSFPIHQLWADAIVVYPQGLPTVSPLVDRKGERSGWQPNAGDNDDRDLKFFDAMLASLKAQYQVDAKRIYATGHSNGGAFTYLLWAERGEIFAALAPSAAVLGRGSMKFRPLPILHIGSPDDELVKFSWQRRMIEHVLAVNGCGSRMDASIGYKSYPSTTNTEVATYLHTNGHRFPETATEQIVKFLQAHAKP